MAKTPHRVPRLGKNLSEQEIKETYRRLGLIDPQDFEQFANFEKWDEWPKEPLYWIYSDNRTHRD